MLCYYCQGHLYKIYTLLKEPIYYKFFKWLSTVFGVELKLYNLFFPTVNPRCFHSGHTEHLLTLFYLIFPLSCSFPGLVFLCVVLSAWNPILWHHCLTNSFSALRIQPKLYLFQEASPDSYNLAAHTVPKWLICVLTSISSSWGKAIYVVVIVYEQQVFIEWMNQQGHQLERFRKGNKVRDW